MTLYEIDQRIEDFEPHIDEKTGELTNTSELDELEMARKDKIEAVACYIKNMTALSVAINGERRKLEEREKAIKAKVEGLKLYLSRSLAGEKFETAQCRVSYRSSKSVEITDYNLALASLEKHHNFCIRYPAPEIRKAELKKLLDSGVTIPGVDIKANRSVIIK